MGFTLRFDRGSKDLIALLAYEAATVRLRKTTPSPPEFRFTDHRYSQKTQKRAVRVKLSKENTLVQRALLARMSKDFFIPNSEL